MKNKKTLYILLSVVAVCLIGVLASKYLHWPVDTDSASGNIGKTSRFSRKTAQEGLSNMQELLLTDNNFQKGVVMSYMVMNTRAKEFNALVDVSEEVAGEIPEFKSVLKDMGKARKMVQNVCESMDAAALDLDTALSGEEAKDLAQSTTNAALAYNTLQKQNDLATRFIDAADTYLAANEGTDALKLVRDQWVDYQKLTAALNGDQDAVGQLEEKGYLLTAEQTASALGAFPLGFQNAVICNTALTEVMGISASLKNVESVLNNTEAALNNTEAALKNSAGEALKNAESVLNNTEAALNNTESVLNNTESALNNTQALLKSTEAALSSSFVLNNAEGALNHLFRLHMAADGALNDIITVEWEPICQSVSGAINALVTGDAAQLQAFNLGMD